jgi:riboflavin kinase/FMN adenylyltransferase
VRGIAAEPLKAVASLGTRPVFNGTHLLLEVHLLDFHEDLYGRFIQVDFLHKLREEQNFEQVGELVAQIKRDVVNAEQYFVVKERP